MTVPVERTSTSYSISLYYDPSVALGAFYHSLESSKVCAILGTFVYRVHSYQYLPLDGIFLDWCCCSTGSIFLFTCTIKSLILYLERYILGTLSTEQPFLQEACSLCKTTTFSTVVLCTIPIIVTSRFYL